MRAIYRVALILALSVTLPALAAEPDAPDALMSSTDAIRIAIQKRLSAKFTSASDVKKSERGALVEYYAAPEHYLLWVDDNGLTARGKAVIDEITKADDYGLRASYYVLPQPDTFKASDSNVTD